VRFSVDAFPDQTFRGDVAQIRLNAQMTQNVVTYTVIVNTDNSSGKLKPYMTANLQFEIKERKGVLLIPNSALRFRPLEDHVTPQAEEPYIKAKRRTGAAAEGKKLGNGSEKESHDQGMVWVEEGGFVRPIKVKIGLTDGAQTEILGGDIQEGTPIVIG